MFDVWLTVYETNINVRNPELKAFEGKLIHDRFLGEVRNVQTIANSLKDRLESKKVYYVLFQGDETVAFLAVRIQDDVYFKRMRVKLSGPVYLLGTSVVLPAGMELDCFPAINQSLWLEQLKFFVCDPWMPDYPVLVTRYEYPHDAIKEMLIQFAWDYIGDVST